MAIKKLTGIPEVDTIANALSKKFEKKGNWITMGPRITTPEVFSSGSLSLNCQLGIGGVPEDRIVEIYGPSSAGKTSLALQFVREYVEKHGYKRPPCFIDLERTTSLDLIKGMGIDPKKMVFAYPDTAEEALQIAKDMGLSNKVGLIVFDSIDAAQTEKETQRLMTEMGVGDLPRMMSKSMRSISKICTDNKVCYIFINQIRMKIGVMYGNPETTSGGNALPFYASLRLRVSSKPSPSQVDTLLMKVKVKKNKMAPALSREAEFDFICGRGTDTHADLLAFSKNLGLIRYAGSAVKVALPNTEEITLCTGGKLGARQHLINNPEFSKQLRSACYIRSRVSTDQESDDNNGESTTEQGEESGQNEAAS
jgi:recombination protein RecA